VDSGLAALAVVVTTALVISMVSFVAAPQASAVERPSVVSEVQSDFPGGPRSKDVAVDGVGDGEGYHVRVAQESSGFAWHDLAVIKPANLDEANWYGYQCVSSDGLYVAVAILPGHLENNAAGRNRGAFAYGVEVATGKVVPLATGVGSMYYSPACGTDDTAVFTASLGNDEQTTQIVRANLSTGKRLSESIVAGQITSAVGVGSRVVGALNNTLVDVASGGTLSKPIHPTKTTSLTGRAYDIRPSQDGGIDFLTSNGKQTTSTVWHQAHAPPVSLGTGPTQKLNIFLGRLGHNTVIGASALKQSPTLRLKVTVSLPLGPEVVSLDADAAFGPQKAAVKGKVSKVNLDPASTSSNTAVVESLKSHRLFKPVPSDSQPPVTQTTGSELLGQGAGIFPGLSTQSAPQIKDSTFVGTGPATPAFSGVTTLASVSSASLGMRPMTPSGTLSTEPAAMVTTTQSAVHALSAGATTPKCSVARLQPTLEAMQPSNAKVNWAVQMAEQGLLAGSTYSRPANFANMGLASYSPSSDFPPISLSHPSGSSWSTVPRSVMLAIAAQESNFNQASWHALPGIAADPLIADYYGAGNAIGTIDYPNADCGYGVGQVTTGMSATDTSISVHGQMKIAVDYQENLAAGLNILEKTWNQLYSSGITLNGGDPKYLENWYFAAWAYNTGIQPTAAFGNTTGCTPSATCAGPDGTWGLGWSNNPKNPNYDPARAPFLRNTYADAAHPSSWPYQERIMGWMGSPIIRYGYTGYDTPAYHGGNTWLQIPPPATFCTGDNLCDPAHVVSGSPSSNYCTLADSECWWHTAVTLIPTCSTTCATSAYQVGAGSTEPTYSSPYPPTCNLDASKVPTTPSGPPIIVDDLATPSQNNQGCTGMNWANGGSFTYSPGTNSSGDPVGNIDTHQLGSGLGGHIWFTHTEPASAPSLINTGTWTPSLPSLQYYTVKIHLPASGATATDVVYTVNPGGGTAAWKIRVNQDWASEQWVTIGTFAMQNGGNVQLTNASNMPAQSYDVAYDAIAFVPQGGTPGQPIGGPPTIQDAPKGSNPAWVNCGCVRRTAGDPVDTSTGYYGETDTDLSTPGLGVGLNLTRTYSSALSDPAGPAGSTGSVNGAFGYGWTYSYGMTATTTLGTGVVTIRQEDGSQVVFNPVTGGYAPSTPRFDATLTTTGSTYYFTRHGQQQFAFDVTTNRLIQESDLAGRTASPTYATSLAYDASGNLATVTDPSGRTYTFLWSGTHIIRVNTTGGLEANYNYDVAGNLITAFGVGTVRVGSTLGNEDRTDFGYTVAHLLNSERSPVNYGKTGTPTPVMSMVYDGSERVTSQTDATGNQTTFVYGPDAAAGLAAGQNLITDGAGHKTLYTYQNGLLTAVTKGFGTTDASTWSYAYDPIGLGISVQTNPDGSTQTFSYDAQGHVTSSSDGLGRTTSKSYDTAGRVLQSVSPDGLQTTSTYNAAGAPTSVVLSLPGQSAESAGVSASTSARTTGYAYLDAAHPALATTVTDPTNNVTTFSYDTYGDAVSVTDAASHVTKFGFDTGRGLQTSVVTPSGTAVGTVVTCAPPAIGCTTYSYDVYGNRLSTVDPLGHSTNSTFDADGNQLTAVDANGHTTTTTFNAADLPISVKQPSTDTATTGYNGDGTVSSTTDAANHATSYTYDAQGRELTTTDPDNKTTTFAYDGLGRQTKQTKPNADTITQAWDLGGQLTGITYSGTSTPAVTYTYDQAGRRLSMSDATGTSTYAYSRFGDQTQAIAGNGQATAFGYDAAGRKTSISYPGTSNTVTQHYNSIGQLDSVTDPASRTTSFAYNADGAPTTTTYPNGVLVTAAYNNADQVTSSALAKAATALGTLTYARDNTGDLNSRTATSGAPGGNYAYTYTANQYLGTSVTGGITTTVAYDNVGNPTGLGAQTQVFDAAGRLCWTTTASVSSPTCGTAGTGATVYASDSNGQRAAQTPTTGSTTSYGWNAAGELASVSGATTAAYLYNGDGLRTRKTVGSAITNFDWDTTGNIPSMLTDGTLDYVYGPTGAPVEQFSPGGTSPSYYFCDAHGSTTALTDGTGAVTATYSYDTAGKSTGHTGAATTPLQFAGQYADAETGFTYLRARYYDPVTALFVSVDALVARTLAAYTFASNNPLNRVDPLGLWTSAGLWALAGAVGLGLVIVGLAATGFGAAADLPLALLEEAEIAAVTADVAASGWTVAGRVAGTVGSALDAGDCVVNGNAGSCVASGFGVGALGFGVVGGVVRGVSGWGLGLFGGVALGGAGGLLDTVSGINGIGRLIRCGGN
jgi:RHS repeat-associated protein